MPRLLAILTIAFLALPGILHAQDAPRLEIPVPGLELTPLLKDDEGITVPWIAQYVQGAYTFLIGVAGLLAAVMMVVGGFQYLTSAGDKGKIGAAKNRIVNALIGLVLAFGSYTILYAINPGLVKFEGLRIITVKPDVMMESAMYTTAETAPADSVSTAAPPNSSPSAPNTPEGPYTGTIYKTCPIAFADPDSIRGVPDFMQKIRENMGTVIDAKTPIDKAVQIGNIASVCRVHIGNCGKSVGTFLALAGVLNKKDCNQYSTTNAECNAWPEIKVHSIPDTKPLWWARCDNEAAAAVPDEPLCPFSGPWLENAPDYPLAKNCDKAKCGCTRQDCVTGQFAAAAKVGKDLLEMAKREPSMAGYPDSWTKDLRRGDWVIMYNGNDDSVGTHSAMFVAWADKDHMITINGSAKGGVKYAQQCVTSGCFNKPLGWGMWQPITRILRHKVR